MILYTARIFRPLHIHPLTYHLIAYILGISLGSSALFITSASLIGLISAAALWQRKKTPIACFILTLLLSNLGGFGTYSLQVYQYHQKTIFVCNKPISLEGVVTSLEYTQGSRSPYRATIQLKKFSNTKNKELRSCTETILVYFTQKPACLIGDTISLEKVTIKSNAHSSFYHYLLRNNYIGTVFVAHDCITILDRPTWCLKRWISNIKERIFNNLKTKMPKASFSFFSSIFLGNRNAVHISNNQEKEYFKQWGISHYLARSGLHVILFIFIWSFLLQLIPLPLYIKQSIFCFILFVYLALSWLSISFIRAWLLFVLYKCLYLLRIPISYLHLVVLVTFAILLINPMHLFFLDFQLSFGLTFALALLSNLEWHANHVKL